MDLKAPVKFFLAYIHAKGSVINIDKLTPDQQAELDATGRVTLPRYTKKKFRNLLTGIVVGKRKIMVTRKLVMNWSGDPDEADRALTEPGTVREIYLVAVNMSSIYKVDAEDVNPEVPF